MVGALTWTYSSTSASLSLKDRVRFLVRDTDTTHQLVQDEEINWALTDVGNNYYAAAATVCRTIGASLRSADMVTVGDVTEKGTQSKDWMDLADEYDRKAVAVGSCPSPFLGGSSVDRRKSNATDTDRTLPRVWFGQFDFPPVSLTSTSTSRL